MTRNSELIGGLFWLAFGLWAAYGGYDLGLGQLRDPGSGFAIFWLGVITAGLATAVVIGALVNGGPSLASLWQGTRWGKVLLVMGLLLLFGFFFEQLGFVLAASVLLLVLMRIVDPVAWHVALPVTALSVGGVWYVVGKLLKIQLPAGVLAPWLG